MNRPDATLLLERLREGDADAGAALFELVYGELRARAGALLGAGGGHTLQATALVNEAWMRLDRAGSTPENRAHFLAVAAKAMRSVLVDHARAKRARKRDGGERILLDEALVVYSSRVPDVLELHDELERLTALDARMARVVELRFFGGLSIDETARVLGVGHATVERAWQTARAWLRSRLTDGQDPTSTDGS